MTGTMVFLENQIKQKITLKMLDTGFTHKVVGIKLENDTMVVTVRAVPIVKKIDITCTLSYSAKQDIEIQPIPNSK